MTQEESVENFEVEIFATKELVINELGTLKNKKLIVLADQASAIANLEWLKVKHEARIGELIIIEELSSVELKELKKINSELKNPRILINKYKTEGVSVIAHCSSQFKSVWDSLISINKPLEDKVYEKIKKEEQRVKDKKAEQERLKQEEEDKIMKSINDFESNSILIIQKMTINSKESDLGLLNDLLTSMVDVEPFDVLMEKAQDRVAEAYRIKVEDLNTSELQRIKNEKLEKENKKAKELADLQAKRLKELAPIMAFVKDVDITNLSSLSQIKYDTILAEANFLYEYDVKQKESEQEKKDADAKADKDAVFEIRKNRLAEIGFLHNKQNQSYFNSEFDLYLNDDVYNSDTLEFENILTIAKSEIQKTKDKAKKLIDDAELKAKQEAEDLRLSIEKANKLKLENEARRKRLANDKALLSEYIDDVSRNEFHYINSDLKNQESKDLFNSMVADKEVLVLKFRNQLENL